MAKPQASLQNSPFINKHVSEILASNDAMLKLVLIKDYQELILIMINSVLSDEVTELTGRRYKRSKKKNKLYRWGTNPGNVVIGQEKISIRVPRVRDEANQSEKTLESYSSTTNVIESLNSQLMKYIGKVKRWTNSEQRFRWVASALLEIEPCLKKVANYRNIDLLIDKIKDDVKMKIHDSIEGILN